ncbi:hypothetical protein ACERK3_17735 [Phycisphaerales bacterium AB-hyl4]|uniref:Uncharacterized protein n=1 Tax=Natronomicrosphaera hydrolytica TaxID=3242702 RepID=A0ABV4UB97_9BACT
MTPCSVSGGPGIEPESVEAVGQFLVGTVRQQMEWLQRIGRAAGRQHLLLAGAVRLLWHFIVILQVQ